MKKANNPTLQLIKGEGGIVHLLSMMSRRLQLQLCYVDQFNAFVQFNYVQSCYYGYIE